MKRIFYGALLWLLMGTSIEVFASESYLAKEDITDKVSWTDTIAVITDANRAVIVREGDKMTLTVNGSGSDKEFYYRYGIEPKIDTVLAPKEKIGVDVPFAGNFMRSASSMRFLKNIYVGANMPVGPGKDLKSGWEIGVGEILGYGYTPNRGQSSFSIGFGFSYRTLNATKGNLFSKVGNTLFLGKAPSEVNDPKAYINFWQLQFPLLYTQKISRSFGFNLGVLLNLNVSAKAHASWVKDEMIVKTCIDNLHQRFFTPDVFATVGIPGYIGAYIKFSPMNAMMHYDGTRMSMLSVGVNLNF